MINLDEREQKVFEILESSDEIKRHKWFAATDKIGSFNARSVVKVTRHKEALAIAEKLGRELGGYPWGFAE